MFENKKRKIEAYKYSVYKPKPVGYVYFLIRIYESDLYHQFPNKN